MPKVDTAALRALEQAAATLSPPTWYYDGSDPAVFCQPCDPTYDPCVADVLHDEYGELIAAYRNAMPAVLDELDAARDLLDRQQKSWTRELELAEERITAREARIAELEAALRPFAGYWPGIASMFAFNLDGCYLTTDGLGGGILMSALRDAHTAMRGKDGEHA